MKNTKVSLNKITILLFLFSILSGYIKNISIIFLIVIIHEFFHILACLFFKKKILEIEILPFGGNLKIDNLLNDPIKENLIIASAGIFIQFILFLLCKVNVITSDLFYKYNIAIMLFNLLPIIPLDGSKIMLEILSKYCSFKLSIKIYYLISILFIIIYLIINIKFNLNNYMIISLFIYKTYEVIRNRNLFYNKFILEKMIYNIKYKNIGKLNEKISYYKKECEYYYYDRGKYLNSKEYLTHHKV